MHRAGNSTGESSRLARAAVWLGLTLALLVGLVGSPFAQSGPGGYGPGPGEYGHGRGPGGEGMRPGGGGRHRMMAPETLEGPPAPAVLRDSIGLSGDQLKRYAQRYANYTAETGPVRDSLRSSVQEMRAAFQSGDRSGASDRRDTIERQAQGLAKRDTDFEKLLKQDLSKDQQKRYDKWKKARDKAQKEEWHHRHRQRKGGNP